MIKYIKSKQMYHKSALFSQDRNIANLISNIEKNRLNQSVAALGVGILSRKIKPIGKIVLAIAFVIIAPFCLYKLANYLKSRKQPKSISLTILGSQNKAIEVTSTYQKIGDQTHLIVTPDITEADIKKFSKEFGWLNYEFRFMKIDDYLCEHELGTKTPSILYAKIITKRGDKTYAAKIPLHTELLKQKMGLYPERVRHLESAKETAVELAGLEGVDKLTEDVYEYRINELMGEADIVRNILSLLDKK